MATPNVLAEDVFNSPTLGADIAAALIGDTKTRATSLDGFLIDTK